MHGGLFALSAALVTAVAVTGQAPRVPTGVPIQDTTVTAQDVTRANQILGTVMSPFCPGLTLANCPSIYAETLRVSVRTRLAAGESPDSIVESLVAAFGEGVRGAPRASGFGLALWLLPGLALAAGAIGLTWWLRTRGVRVEPLPAENGAGTNVPSATPEERARLEAALRQYQ